MARYPKQDDPKGKKRPPNYKGYYKDKVGNCYIHMPEHPYSTKQGYVLEHRLMVENILGRHLKPDEHIHHINGNRWDDRNKNFIVCQGNTYHRLLHKREKALKECGHASWLICRYCHKYDDPNNMIVKNRADGGIRAWHRECCRVYSNERYRRNKNAKICQTG